MHADCLSKNHQEVWKAWHRTFANKITSQAHFPDCTFDADIAREFAKLF
jgi:hypothetical protein